jgi:hypothetical protein
MLDKHQWIIVKAALGQAKNRAAYRRLINWIQKGKPICKDGKVVNEGGVP